MYLCPGKNYTFNVNTACEYYLSGDDATFGMHYVVHFNGQTIVPSTRACGPCPAEIGDCHGYDDIYTQVSTRVTGPPSGSALLEIIVTGTPGLNGGPVLPFLIDNLSLYLED